MTGPARERYRARAQEYAELFGSVSAVHADDLALVERWAAVQTGLILDAGCGPGQWTAHLASLGHHATGVDQVAAFVARARAQYREVPFVVGDLDRLPYADRSCAGVLAWYSLIHHRPSQLPAALAEFARVLRPGGGLLVGFFTGERPQPFDHAVTTAYRWPPAALAERLGEAGFEVLATHTRAGTVAGPRPHGAILARAGCSSAGR